MQFSVAILTTRNTKKEALFIQSLIYVDNHSKRVTTFNNANSNVRIILLSILYRG
jgi:hypothetical protein